jgi:hypothetical protein
MLNIIYAGLFDISQILGIIQVSLRIEVAVAHFDWVIKPKFSHITIIHSPECAVFFRLHEENRANSAV